VTASGESGLVDLVPSGSEVSRLGTGFGFTEGPVWNPQGDFLLFSDIPENVIRRWDERSGFSEWRRPSSMANGLTYDAEFRLLACEAASSLVTRAEPDGPVTTTVASHFAGKELNSPNDIVVRSDGTIYFTDPPSGRAEPHGVPRPRHLDFQGVFRVPLGVGRVELEVSDMVTPNGLCLSPDENVLYINDSNRMHIRAFRVARDGTLSGGDVVFVQTGYTPDRERHRRWLMEKGRLPHGVPDGMKCDERGNIWCTGHGGIWVISPDGELLGVLPVPEIPANLAWGGPNFTTLFVCATHSLYRIETLVRGCAPGATPARAASGQ
jgi:gluconolactonase